MIGFIGLSHLGLVYATATAAKGFSVLGLDPREDLCAAIRRGELPVSEPGLDELFRANRNRLEVSSDWKRLEACELVFFALDVPTDSANRSDLGPLRELMERAVPFLNASATVVVLCQVPPGFTRKAASGVLRGVDSVFYQVETLVFGNAVERAMKPERYMVGGADPAAGFSEAYERWLKADGCPILPMRFESAELAKIAINFFLVASVSTTNVLAEVCERIGADWSEIAPALRLDRRIGPHAYLSPGLGIAGGNLERDLCTVQSLAFEHGTDSGMIAAWQFNSRHRRDWVLRKIHREVLSANPSARLAWWGLAYKQDTHSVKNSPSVAAAEALPGIVKVAYDPRVTGLDQPIRNLEWADSALQACRGADALVIMTPWREFASIRAVDLSASLAGSVVIDPYGVLDSKDCRLAGLKHHRLGCGVI
jgi:UDPglucose 6-dehydrogenase